MVMYGLVNTVVSDGLVRQQSINIHDNDLILPDNFDFSTSNVDIEASGKYIFNPLKQYKAHWLHLYRK